MNGIHLSSIIYHPLLLRPLTISISYKILQKKNPPKKIAIEDFRMKERIDDGLRRRSKTREVVKSEKLDVVFEDKKWSKA